MHEVFICNRFKFELRNLADFKCRTFFLNHLEFKVRSFGNEIVIKGSQLVLTHTWIYSKTTVKKFYFFDLKILGDYVYVFLNFVNLDYLIICQLHPRLLCPIVCYDVLDKKLPVLKLSNYFMLYAWHPKSPFVKIYDLSYCFQKRRAHFNGETSCLKIMLTLETISFYWNLVNFFFESEAYLLNDLVSDDNRLVITVHLKSGWLKCCQVRGVQSSDHLQTALVAQPHINDFRASLICCISSKKPLQSLAWIANYCL